MRAAAFRLLFGQKVSRPTDSVLAKSSHLTAFSVGNFRLLLTVQSTIMARAPLPRPAPAAGSPENFSLATFQVTHMIVCRSASSSRSWCSQRNLWRKSFQGSHRRARTRAPWLFLVGPARGPTDSLIRRRTSPAFPPRTHVPRRRRRLRLRPEGT